ncbi:tryptophan synthase subunit alpha [Geobacter pelophilus]|uniref:Tryptophan synthase alpha chain n=1 Tax=Geoanaerobacter pelophilus TaxID=60036 RepID=A0AAW4L568_9BACT|nr:tryptophan synthase subunit alpha [Geoanaerobacter pelophilus]MBT0663189.1 tryptophan synthase subunit alpha [Geoanaerobacter pelophilus]
MSRIPETFKRLQLEGKKALVTFITAGDPDLETTGQLIPLLENAGADIIELGVPFSDPMADGPTIQLSSERALASGTTLAGILELVQKVRLKTQIPLVLMGYYNPILQYGLERFVADAARAGVDGVLLVDLPPEEAGVFRKLADAAGITTIFLLTPTSDEARMKRVFSLGSGFLYYVSVTGVTGARQQVEVSVADRVSAIRQRTKLPVVVGFGVSTPEQAGQLAAIADGVVVGSALVKLFERHKGAELEKILGESVAALKKGMN